MVLEYGEVMDGKRFILSILPLNFNILGNIAVTGTHFGNTSLGFNLLTFYTFLLYL